MSLLACGCLKKHNPYYCPGLNPDDNCAESDGGGPPCTESSQCPMTTPVCDLLTDKHCRGCRSHQECPASKTCLPDGSCASTSSVAYVSSLGTDNLMCELTSPCARIGTALALGRPYLKLGGMLDEAVEIARDVTVLADPGTTLTRTNNSSLPHNILIITGTSNVKIYDLAINGSLGTDAGLVLPAGNRPSVTLHHVSMSGHNGIRGAIDVAGGTINIYRSTISGNMGGGISIATAEFDIENNVITANGNASSLFGGIRFQIADAAGAHILSFNTISTNAAKIDAAPGVECVLVTASLTFSNNLIYKNLTPNDQVNGSYCFWTYSDIQVVTGTIPGIGNLNADPMFVDVNGGNFHLQSSSPVIDKADPDATIDIDIDGDARPQHGRRDIGADEYMSR